MAWLAMAIQIISPCEVFLVTKEGGGRFRISRFGGLFNINYSIILLWA